MRGEGDVAGGRESCWCIPKFHSWGKCIIPLTKLISTQIGSPTPVFIYASPVSWILGIITCNSRNR